MAATITLLKDFAGGQGVGAADYFVYAADLDSNFVSLETTVNALVAEVTSIQGPNAALPIDILTSTSPAIALGILGIHSYLTVINGGDASLLDVAAGVALVSVGRVELGASVQVTSSGGSGTRFVAVNSDGTVSVETAASQQELDLYSVNWNGTAFDGSLTLLTDVMFDGDDYQDQLTVAGNASAGPPSQTHTKMADRLENIERILRATTANLVSGATALGPLAFGGSESAPGLILGDGTTFEADTGFFRAGVDRIAASIVGVKAFEISAEAHIDSPTQPRAKATRTAVLNISSSATLGDVAFDAEDYDVDTMHDTSTNNDRVTIPTGGDGIYAVVANGRFDESTSSSPNAGDREIAITINGTVESSDRRAAVGAGDTRCSVGDQFTLAAGDIVRAQIAQDSGGTMDVADLTLAVIKLW